MSIILVKGVNCDVITCMSFILTMMFFAVSEATGVQRMEWAETGLYGLVETEGFKGGVEELHNILVV